MPMSRHLVGFFIAIAALALPAGGSGASDESRLASAANTQPVRIAAVTGGAAAQGSMDFENIVERGGLEARLKLARVYASGKGAFKSGLQRVCVF